VRTSAIVALAVVLACGKKEPSAEGAKTGATASAGGGGAVVAAAVHVERFDAAEIGVPPGKSQLHVAWSVPEGTAINDDAPFGVRWGSSDGLVTPPNDIRGAGRDVRGGFDVPIETMAGAEGAKLCGDVDLVVCDVATHAVCVPLKRKLQLTLAVGKGATQGRVTLPLPKAKP
jgi:hypothetical protein